MARLSMRSSAALVLAIPALWLASDASAFVTGETITVDGGLVAASPLRPGLF